MELKDYLPGENTEFACRFDDWRECILKAGELLETNMYIEHSYTEAMIATVESTGPYIVIIPGVALAHARPVGNVKKNGISLVTLSEGLFFGNEDNDPVYAVFAVAACSDKEHLKLFKALGRYLSDESNVKKLIGAKRYGDLFG